MAALKNCPKSEGQSYPKRKAEILSQVPEGGYMAEASSYRIAKRIYEGKFLPFWGKNWYGKTSFVG